MAPPSSFKAPLLLAKAQNPDAGIFHQDIVQVPGQGGS